MWFTVNIGNMHLPFNLTHVNPAEYQTTLAPSTHYDMTEAPSIDNVTTVAPSAAYDAHGAMMYVVIVVTFYSLSIMMLLLMLCRRRTRGKLMDKEVDKYFKGLEDAARQARVERLIVTSLTVPGNYVTDRFKGRRKSRHHRPRSRSRPRSRLIQDTDTANSRSSSVTPKVYHKTLHCAPRKESSISKTTDISYGSDAVSNISPEYKANTESGSAQLLLPVTCPERPTREARRTVAPSFRLEGATREAMNIEDPSASPEGTTGLARITIDSLAKAEWTTGETKNNDDPQESPDNTTREVKGTAVPSAYPEEAATEDRNTVAPSASPERTTPDPVRKFVPSASPKEAVREAGTVRKARARRHGHVYVQVPSGSASPVTNVHTLLPAFAQRDAEDSSKEKHNKDASEMDPDDYM